MTLLCPLCKVNLTMADRQGIEIDYCPQCRGVWLDRGELDKLIDRAEPTRTAAQPQSFLAAAPPAPAHADPPRPRRSAQQWHDDDDDDDRQRDDRGRRRNWLSELFD